MANNLRDKVVAAFKGFIRTYKLLPVKERDLIEESEYVGTFQLFRSETEWSRLFYKKRSYRRLIDLVDRLFHGQTDSKFVSRCLEQVATEWIEQGYSTDDQARLEQSAADFLEKVEQGIKDRVLHVPVEGLKFGSRQDLQLAKCQLCHNHPDSELMKAVRQDRKRFSRESEEFDEHYSSVEQAPAFFRVSVPGHSGRATQRSTEEVDLALNVLRFFLGSFYFDIYRQPSTPRRMGIVGTLPTIGPHSNVFFAQADVPIEEQFPGMSVQYKHLKLFELDYRKIENLNNNSILIRINQLLSSLETGSGTDVARRLLRTVNWFGKASTASSIAESFLMYAISVEALLSEGQTRKETYAKQIATLVIRHDSKGLYPFGGYLSSKFNGRLSKASCKKDRFTIVNDRVVELFSYRNDVAHGRVLENEIEPVNLLDLETLVRNSILSFVDGGWDTLEQFKVWLNQNLPQ